MSEKGVDARAYEFLQTPLLDEKCLVPHVLLGVLANDVELVLDVPVLHPQVVVDHALLAFLLVKERAEEAKLDRIEDSLLWGAHVSAEHLAAWRRWARCQEEAEEEEEKASLRLPSGAGVWPTSLCTCSGKFRQFVVPVTASSFPPSYVIG